MLQFRDCAICDGTFQIKLVKVAVDRRKSSPVCSDWLEDVLHYEGKAESSGNCLLQEILVPLGGCTAAAASQAQQSWLLQLGSAPFLIRF